ncbi:translation initiation factor IF-2 [Brachyspira murdochii]|uniref:translation initiation factor IF-2 n=1 Tax=Brachyspira murdochii TaxID=84378 RepID=UPI0012F48689|nr:translation initiation factor IF-2 [Brachyspira murdochii]
MSQKNENNEKNLNQESSQADNKPKVIIKKANNNSSNNDDSQATAAVKKVKKVIVKKKIIIHNKSDKQEVQKQDNNSENAAKNFNSRDNRDNRENKNKNYSHGGREHKDFNNNRETKDNKLQQITPPADDVSSFKKDNKKDNKKRDYEKKDKEYDKKSSQKDSKAEAAQRQENKIFNKMQAKKRQQEQRLASVEKEISIMETITVGDLAKKMNLRASDIISKLMGMGTMARVNDIIDSDTATIIADDFGCKVNVVSLQEEATIEVKADKEEDLKPRPPVVTIMGHVDHGKTSLLDAIRHSNITSKESGGITQNIGAYKVKIPSGEIAFIDTPGHAAFTMMRARGAKSTDIVILVVASDDGVMPQTIEALNHAKEANVPIIVAVNKMDLPNASMDKVKAALSEYGLTPEEWGGDTQYIGVSALTKQGINELLEAIILQAEMLELKANPNREAIGIVLEASLDQGRGPVGTVLVQNGTLKIGDYFVCGLSVGKVRAMVNDLGQRVTKALPSTPVEVLGFEKTPEAGEAFNVMLDEKEAKAIADKRVQLKQQEALKANVKVTLENLYEKIASDAMKEFKVIIKADVQGSAEALRDALNKIQSDKIRFVSIYSASGAVTESDVNLAHASNAIIIAYRVRPSAKARELAEKLGIPIERYDIIYEAIEAIQNAMKGSLERIKKEVDIGTVEVRDVFHVPKVGTIAGCYVTSGKIERNASVRVMRDNVLIYTSKISSLRRVKDDVKEVATGYECGASIENFNDIKKGDILEIFKIEEIAQDL